MAKARAKVKGTETTVLLSLSEDEANFVLSVMGRVGGQPGRTARRYQPRISDAIRGALGMDFMNLGKFNDEMTGSIDCLDLTEQ